MKTNFLLSLLLILPALCFSQADFRKGFIVTNAADTVRGLVLYDKTSKAYHTVEFRQSSTQNTTTYAAEQIVGYGFEGSTVYESRKIELKDGSHATKFLQVFVRGAVSLYYYAGEWWIEKEQQGLTELVNEQREVIVNGQRVQRNSNQHLGTLNTMMFDCIEVRPALKSVALTEHTLVQLVTNYNRCKGSEAKVFKENNAWRAYRLGIIGGLNISSLTLTSNKEGWAHTVGKFDPSSSTAFGVSLSFRTSKTNRNYSFTGALLYVATEALNYNVIEHISYETRNWVNVSIQQLKIPVGLRYTFSSAKVAPFLNAGFSTTFHLTQDAYWKQEYEDAGGTTTRFGQAFEMRGNQLGAWGGAGLAFSLGDKLDATLEGRYEITGGVSDALKLRSTVSNVQIFLGLKKK